MAVGPPPPRILVLTLAPESAIASIGAKQSVNKKEVAIRKIELEFIVPLAAYMVEIADSSQSCRSCDIVYQLKRFSKWPGEYDEE